MRSIKQAAGIVGVLFLLQMFTAVSSHAILDPILYETNFLTGISVKSNKIILAMFLDLVCGASVFGIAVILFPILKKYNEPIALWYVGLRLNEWVTLTISGIFLLTILSIGKEFVQPGIHDNAYLQTLGKYLVKARGATLNLMLIGFCLSASLFYYLLFKSTLVPRFISIWGLAGVLLLFAEILSNISGHSLGGIIIMLPMGLNELFLGVWLIIKGFNKYAVVTDREN